jgi:RNA polymerase sigma factor (sigma-70 family)
VGRGATILDPPAAALRDAPEGRTDHELVAALRRGDDRAFEQLYSRYQRRISAYVFGMVKDYGRAEDVTQEVFISALRRMRETERPINFKPWVYEIAKNACIDQFRRSRRAEEVSFDAGDGLGSADQGRLVAGEPTPDAAVDAKQQLDHLCGAFGGLSDSHHEILVLRELEGLSYREIGDRMGLSRPGVESTLFRARKRLGEEYDELVSGQRCVRIQSIIASAESAAPGARDSRRLARHISHCQPCRRQAAASGLDVAALAQKPLRKRIAERAAAFLPLPGFLRARIWPGGEQLVPVSEPMAAGWSKAAVAAATLIVAGVGASVAPHPGGGAPPQRDKAKPAPAVQRSSADPRAARAQRPLGATASPARTRKTKKSHAGSRDRASLGSQPGSGAPSSSAPAGGGGSQTSVPTTPAASNPSRSASKPSRDSASLPKTPLPPVASPVANQVTGQVDNTVDQAAQTVTGTVNQAGQTVTDTVDGVTDTVDGATGGATGGLPKVP